MKTLRLPLLFIASLLIGYFTGVKNFGERYPSVPAGDR
jgi:hypothetical protein